MRQYLQLPETEADLPIVFNEFCTTWGVPEEKMIERMANILVGKGIRYFVIDAGWFDHVSLDKRTKLGEWETDEVHFPSGMKHTADIIRKRGMLPGIWFEFEIVGRDSSTFSLTEHLLKRDGIPITSGNRRFWDMRQSWVQEYLAEKVIRLLKECGFSYIKVDYNDTIENHGPIYA